MTSDDGFAVRIEPQGWQFQAPRDQSLREAAARAGVVLPSSCRNGTCRECLCRLLEGRVSYAIEWPGLSADEKREGCILPCVARAESALVIEAPRALPLSLPPAPAQAGPGPGPHRA